jgi:hypothetical protein
MHVTPASDIRHDPVIRNIERNIMSTQLMVSDMRRAMEKGQEVNDSRNLLVGDIHCLSATE